MVKRYLEKIEHLPRSFQIMIIIFVKRLDSGKNCMVAIVGGTGSGKSWGACSIIYYCFLYMHGRKPTVEEMTGSWSFKAKQFVKKMNDSDLKKKGLNLWDEMGVSVSHKTHQSIQNRVISYLVQTFRNLQQLVIFTVPMTSFLDKSVRNLLHYQLETRHILKTQRICIIKPLELQYNLRIDKMFYHNLVYPSRDGSGLLDEVDVVGIPSPPKEIVDAYERIAGDFKRELTKELETMLDKLEQPNEFKGLMGEDLIIAKIKRQNSFQARVLEYFEQGITKTGEIAKLMGKLPSSVSQYILGIKNKGVNMHNLRRKTPFSVNKSENISEITQVINSDNEKKTK